MKKVIFTIATLSMLFMGSCTKDIVKEGPKPINNEITDMNEMIVPVGFNWENSRDVTMNISTSDIRFQDAVHVISIYDENPLAGGQLIARGAASVSSPFVSKINLSNTLKRVFVSKISPDGSEISRYIDANSTIVNEVLDYTIQVGKKGLGKTSPDCSSGCTSTITSSASNINVASNGVACVTGNNITVSFNVSNGGTVKICGTNVTVSGLSLNNGSKLIITSTGSATFSNLNMNGNTTTFENWGTVNISGSFSPGGPVTNHGIFRTTDDFSLNTTSGSTNNGTMTIGKKLNVNGGCTFTNNSSIIASQDIQVNGTGVLINNCYLKTLLKYQNSGTTRNYGYIRVEDETTINGSSEVGLYSGAMFRTKHLQLNGMIKGYVSTSLFKVTNDTRINGGGSVINFVQFCDLNGIETNNGTIGSGATQSCGLYLAVTTCNPEGNGTAPVNNDTDGDGVSNSLDEYPTDALKAFNNYYPSASGKATVSFEDQWPSKGDYDMNDIVMSYRYNVVTNASNIVVQVIGNYTLFATGGQFNVGFGVEFPIVRAKATGLTGGTLEASQTNAVVTLFSNARAEMVQWNTRPTDPYSDSVNYNINFSVTAGPTLSTFGLNSFNPFIWNNTSGYGRGYEIHLPGKTPTTLANSAYFGTKNDNTNVAANRYYVTSGNGLPWAINVPVKFDYPIERADITTAHLKFASWVQSNGATYANWYTNGGVGYRNTSNVYVKP
ncbi:MAG: LruC domain-containing protein [Bacteroidia bacterium]